MSAYNSGLSGLPKQIALMAKRLEQLEKQVADLTERVEIYQEGEQAYVEKIAEMRQEINALTQTNKIEPSINAKNDHNGGTS